MKTEIKQARRELLPGLFEIERLSFADPWSESMLLDELENDRSVFLAAFQEDTLCGFIAARTVLDEAEVYNVAVSPAFRRRGVASGLLRSLTELLRDRNVTRVYLEVRARNEGAVKLYEKHGFMPAGLRKGYYEMPADDAVLMTLDLEAKNNADNVC